MDFYWAINYLSLVNKMNSMSTAELAEMLREHPGKMEDEYRCPLARWFAFHGYGVVVMSGYVESAYGFHRLSDNANQFVYNFDRQKYPELIS